MVAAVGVEDIEAWDADLSALTRGLEWLFARPEPKQTFGLLVRALLADVGKKNCWGMSEYAGLPSPKRFQHLLNAASWDADALRDWVRGYVLAALAHPDGALVLDDTQAIKKGRMSVGVAPQHCGATGQTENCQCMVMLTYASTHGHAFIDRELYLPECWTSDRARCTAAGVPAGRDLVTKPHLGIGMLARALADPALVFGWAVGDSGYGRDPKLRAFCHQRTLAYVFAVPVDLPLLDVRGTALRPDVLLAATREGDWERRSCGSGGKGQRYWDFAAHAVTVKGQRPAPGYALVRQAPAPLGAETASGSPGRIGRPGDSALDLDCELVRRLINELGPALVWPALQMPDHHDAWKCSALTQHFSKSSSRQVEPTDSQRPPPPPATSGVASTRPAP